MAPAAEALTVALDNTARRVREVALAALDDRDAMTDDLRLRWALAEIRDGPIPDHPGAEADARRAARERAARILAAGAPTNSEAVAAIAAALNDPIAAVRAAAAEALDAAGRMTDPLRRQRWALDLADADPAVRHAAAERLDRLGVLTTAMRARLCARDLAGGTDQEKAARELARLGPDARAALPALIESFDGLCLSAPAGAAAVLEAIARIGPPPDPSAAGAMLACVRNPRRSDALRAAAVEALAAIGQKDALEEIIEDPATPRTLCRLARQGLEQVRNRPAG
jgi:hypothetical protein